MNSCAALMMLGGRPRARAQRSSLDAAGPVRARALPPTCCPTPPNRRSILQGMPFKEPGVTCAILEPTCEWGCAASAARGARHARGVPDPDPRVLSRALQRWMLLTSLGKALDCSLVSM